jgi:hypothetical protein
LFISSFRFCYYLGQNLAITFLIARYPPFGTFIVTGCGVSTSIIVPEPTHTRARSAFFIPVLRNDTINEKAMMSNPLV